jgi:hypothetical protein
MRRAAFAGFAVAALAAFAGCRQDMHDQPRVKALSKSTFYEDKRGARPLVEGTVARGDLRDDEHLYTGKSAGAFAASYPFPIDEKVLQRGRQRFAIYCTPCHGQTGYGEGMVVQRGFKRPTSFHIDRLRHAPPGYFFDVMTNGFGAMADYSAQVPVKDRWAIAAYIQALQLSQHASAAELSAEARAKLEAPEPQASHDAPSAETRH